MAKKWNSRDLKKALRVIDGLRKDWPRITGAQIADKLNEQGIAHCSGGPWKWTSVSNISAESRRKSRKPSKDESATNEPKSIDGDSFTLIELVIGSSLSQERKLKAMQALLK